MKRREMTLNRQHVLENNKNHLVKGRTLAVLIFLTALLLLPMTALAELERYVLDFGDRHIGGRRGQPATLMLKRALKQQYPWINTRNLTLRNVILVAKSRVGRGHAQLRVGRRVSDYYRVAGHPRAFKKNHRKTYDRVRLYSPTYNSRGPWQINLSGNFKVRKIVLIAENHNRRYYDW
ncbi:MAG: hypothetical protein HKP41_16360 [Desulfobacterales bacterium]|nr:hypothetical protein [Desulfobacterales bacterium]